MVASVVKFLAWDKDKKYIDFYLHFFKLNKAKLTKVELILIFFEKTNFFINDLFEKNILLQNVRWIIKLTWFGGIKPTKFVIECPNFQIFQFLPLLQFIIHSCAAKSLYNIVIRA